MIKSCESTIYGSSEWYMPYSTLGEGEYRILKSVIPDDDDDGKSDEYWLAAELTITGQ